MTASICDETEALTELTRTLQVSVAGADKTAIELEIRNTVREFCTRSNAWVTFYATTTKKDKEFYDITPVDGQADVSTVIAVSIEGRPIAGWSGSYMPQTYGRRASHYITNPEELVENSINTLKLGSVYITDTEKEMVVTMALRPKNGLLYLPNMLGFDYFDVLAAGAMARMLLHVNRPYSDPAGASFKRQEFLSGLTRAREKTQARFSKLTIPWTYPQVAPGRRYR